MDQELFMQSLHKGSFSQEYGSGLHQGLQTWKSPVILLTPFES
jgi:hypothetical protein